MEDLIMSMRDYAVDDYGMILDEEIIKVIASKVYEDYTEDVADWGFELYNNGFCEYIGEFTGEAHEITDDGVFTWGGDSIEYYNDAVYYVRGNPLACLRYYLWYRIFLLLYCNFTYKFGIMHQFVIIIQSHPPMLLCKSLQV